MILKRGVSFIQGYRARQRYIIFGVSYISKQNNMGEQAKILSALLTLIQINPTLTGNSIRIHIQRTM